MRMNPSFLTVNFQERLTEIRLNTESGEIWWSNIIVFAGDLVISLLTDMICVDDFDLS